MLKMFQWAALIASVVLIVAVAGAIVSSQRSIELTQRQSVEKNPAGYHAEESGRTLWDRWFPDSISLYTLFLVVFTAVLALGALYQLKVLERSERITADTAQAARDSAEAAKKAVELSDKTAERQLRAYVSLVAGGITLVNLVEGGLGLSIHVQLRNSGQTPGYKFTTWIKKPEILDPGALPFTPPTSIEERTGTSIIGPGGDVHLNWTLPVNSEMLDDIAKGRKRVFVWGGADFIDAFGTKRYFIFRDVSGTGVFGGAGQQLPLQPHKLGYDAN